MWLHLVSFTWWVCYPQQLQRDDNPADALLDLLKKENLQKQLVASYWNSGDPLSIKQAVKVAKTTTTREDPTTFKYGFFFTVLPNGGY